MTITERNNLNDRERIKQYLENSLRVLCDDLSDIKDPSVALIKNTAEIMLNYSTIYKNMGFDKAHGEEKDRKNE